MDENNIDPLVLSSYLTRAIPNAVDISGETDEAEDSNSINKQPAQEPTQQIVGNSVSICTPSFTLSLASASLSMNKLADWSFFFYSNFIHSNQKQKIIGYLG